MLWICQNNSFEIYKIDTENVQESLKAAYDDSAYLNEKYGITENSKFSLIEHGGVIDTFVDGKPAESFWKSKLLAVNKRE